MGRRTNGRVNKINVTTRNISDILNSDSSNLNQSPIKSSDFFKDVEGSNDIYDNFIDETYCPADAGELKKDKLTRNPHKWGHYRNYGGDESGEGVTCEIPEIYFKSGITENNGQFIPQTTRLLDYFEEKKLIPTLTLYPNLAATQSYINEGLASSKGLFSNSASSLHREGSRDSVNVGKYKIATKIGADYVNTKDACGVPEFKIKITPYIAGVRVPYVKLTETYSGYDVLAGWNDILTDTANDPVDLVTLIESSYDWSYYNPVEDLKVVESLGNDISSNWVNNKAPLGDLVGNYQATQVNLAAELVQGVSTVLMAASLFDMVWDSQHPVANISDASYQYSNAVVGNYTFRDILSSKHSVGGGNKHYLSDKYSEDSVNSGGVEYSFNFNDELNYGEAYDVATNKINSYPNPLNTNDKYLNFDFDPQCIQYDLNVPPAAIEYLIEIVPVRYCTLSTTKITAFSVKIMPDRFLAPNFQYVATASYQDPGTAVMPALYKNSIITFLNAKYCDFILMKDEDIDDEFLGVGGQYYNVALNRDGNIPWYLHNLQLRSSTFYPGIQGLDTVFSPGDAENTSGGFLGETGNYTMYFMQEKAGNLIFNPEFRLEKDDSAGRRYAEVNKYWNYTSGLEIRSGAIYKDVAEGDDYLYQNIPTIISSSIFKKRYYTLEFSCNIDAGNIELLATNTAFKAILMDPYSYKTPAGYFERMPALPPSGVEVTASNINFTASGDYTLILETRDSIIAEELKFKLGPDVVASISKCRLQLLPNSSTGEPSKLGLSFFGKTIPLSDTTGRGARNAVTYYNSKVQSVVKYFAEVLNSGHIILDYNNGSADSTTYVADVELPPYMTLEVIWNYFDGTTDSDSYLDYSETENYAIHIERSLTKPLKYIMLDVTNNYSGEDQALTLIKINSLECHDSKLHGIYDSFGLLSEANVDLSDSGFGYYFVDSSTRRTVTLGSKYFSLAQITTKTNILNVSGTSVSENIDSIVYGQSTTGETNPTGILAPLSQIILSNTDISGHLATIITTPIIECINTNISYFGTGQPSYLTGVVPSITWKNSTPAIPVSELHSLLFTLDNSTTENGYLDIAGDNPEITNEDALTAIDNLVGKGWNVLYNAIEEWDYVGVMTVGDSGDEDTYFTGFSGGGEGEAFGQLMPIDSNIFSLLHVAYIEGDGFLNLYVNGVDVDSVVTEINEVEYIIPKVYQYGYILPLVNTPFPSAGETCDIKLKYTLA